MSHFIAGSGSHGCLYDSCTVHESVGAAVDELCERFNLGTTRRKTLRTFGYLELVPTFAEDSFGADYCEIVECNCGNPTIHDDNAS